LLQGSRVTEGQDRRAADACPGCWQDTGRRDGEGRRTAEEGGKNELAEARRVR